MLRAGAADFSTRPWTSDRRVGGSKVVRSSDEFADTTGSSDALLGDLGEHLGAHNAGHVGKFALAEHLDEALHQLTDVYFLTFRGVTDLY